MATKYGFSKDTPVHEITGYFPGKEGILVIETKQVRGLTPFGPQAGVITEDDLSDSVVDFLMSKADDKGNKLYERFLVKKKEAKEDK